MHWSMLAMLVFRSVLVSKTPLPAPLKQRLKHRDPRIRQLAVASLVCKRNPHERKALHKAFRDRHLFVRWRAVVGLSMCARIPALRSLRQAAQDPHHLVRVAAVFGLVRFRGKAPYLVLRRLVDDRHPTVRTYAIVGLVKKGYRLSFPLLRQVLRSSERPQEALLALTAIENLKAWRAFAPLRTALRNKSARVRRRALLSFAHLCRLRRRFRAPCLRLLLRHAKRRNQATRGVALVALSMLGHRPGLARLRRIMQHGPANVALFAVDALHMLRSATSLRWLAWASHSPFPKVRAKARLAMREWHSSQRSAQLFSR